MRWRDLAEHQIQKAKADGQLDDLSGQGKPLAMQGCDDIVSAGMGIMAQAGVLPREIELKKAVAAQRQVSAGTTDPDQRKAEMGRLADLELRLNIEQEARRKFYRTS
ncbi:DUF1992 domain-containing protein [Epibacterium ulvae]|uniref:DnaJ family domain-containing protein n=1 Tax=Epibacterium ulvae TaxID=1156985 RepID=UPI001BFC66F0|nr:DnaJ family domain-containing protein [Epibacterium ulvae]MBT8154594.1 DUF1992 domain-containing protein [Epibacterium ulvae]